jgi:peptidoglycan/LPS O-acetylase OafA/YrhL
VTLAKELKAPRYLFIDGLRGVAAMLVMIHHCYAPWPDVFNPVLPGFARHGLMLGARGVQIFFVISGFVIALSLARVTLTPRSVGNFILRRQLRLDPAYWVCLAIVATNFYVASRYQPGRSAPGALDLFLNAFYLPRFFHRPMILSIAWTLALEVQFYLIFVLIAWVDQTISRAREASAVGVAIVFGLAVVSLVRAAGLEKDSLAVWFIDAWYLFAMGVLTFWAVSGRASAAPLFALIAAVLAVSLWRSQSEMLVGAVSAAIIYAAGVRGRMGTWLSGRIIQYLGGISYSIYLVHWLVLFHLMNAGIAWTGRSVASGLLWALVGCATSIVAAHLLHVLVEQPSMRAAARLKPRIRSETAEPIAACELLAPPAN